MIVCTGWIARGALAMAMAMAMAMASPSSWGAAQAEATAVRMAFDLCTAAIGADAKAVQRLAAAQPDMELHPAAKSSNATAQRNITEALGLPPDAPYYRITLKPPSVDPIIFGALRPDLKQCLVFVSGKSDVARLLRDRLAAPDSGWESRGSLRDASTWQRAGPGDTALTMAIAAGANSAIIIRGALRRDGAAGRESSTCASLTPRPGVLRASSTNLEGAACRW